MRRVHSNRDKLHTRSLGSSICLTKRLLTMTCNPFRCFACQRLDLMTLLIWSDVLCTMTYICPHCLIWRCRKGKGLRGARVLSPPHLTPTPRAQSVLDGCLDCSWKVYQSGVFVSHCSKTFRSWLVELNVLVNDTCVTCGASPAHGLYHGGTNAYQFGCCKTCIKWLVQWGTLNTDEDFKYWTLFDYVRTRNAEVGYREIWIGTVEFLFWLCEDEGWFRALLRGPTESQ